MTPAISGQCDNCKNNLWFKKGLKRLHCKAFSKGIPNAILTEEFDHTKKFPGQKNDILFEPITKEG